MGVTAPSASLVIVTKGQLTHPPMRSTELAAALLNTNWLYLYHRPQNNSTIALSASAGRDLYLWFPVIPSVDAIKYRFEQGIYAGAVGVVTKTVEWSDAAMAVWTVLQAATAVATINGHVFHSFTAVLPATAAVVRVKLAYDGVTAFRPGQTLIWPQHDVIAAGIPASGFRPYDQTLIQTAGTPINTEMLDRVLHNSNAVLRDRWQGVCGFAQGSTGATATYSVQTLGFSTLAKFRPKIPLPESATYSLSYAVIASVDIGATADLILISTPLGAVTVAADGALHTGTITCTGTRPLITVGCKATAGNNTYLHSFAMFWLPDAQPTNICGGAISPIAKNTLLSGACQAVQNSGAAEYAAPAHCAELNIIGASDRAIFKQIIPLGTSHLRWRAWRAGVASGLGGAPQTKTLASTTTAGGMVAPNISQAQSAVVGAECFVHNGETVEITGGMMLNDAPAANKARVLQTTEQLAPYAETCEIRQVVGACFEPALKTADLETL